MFGFCVGKCHDFNQPLTHTLTLALGECLWMCVLSCAVLLLLPTLPLPPPRLLLFSISKQVFQVRVYMHCWSSSVSTTLWRFTNWGSECAGTIKKHCREIEKPVCRWEGESNRRNSTNQNKTIHATCHVTRHTAMLVWVRTEFSFRSELPSQRRLQSIFENQRKKLQWLWTELTALEKLCNFILQA